MASTVPDEKRRAPGWFVFDLFLVTMGVAEATWALEIFSRGHVRVNDAQNSHISVQLRILHFFQIITFREFFVYMNQSKMMI